MMFLFKCCFVQVQFPFIFGEKSQSQQQWDCSTAEAVRILSIVNDENGNRVAEVWAFQLDVC